MEDFKIIKLQLQFNEQVQHLQTEFNSLFKEKKLVDYYRVRADNTKGTFFLEITDKDLPNAIQERLFKLFLDFTLKNKVS